MENALQRAAWLMIAKELYNTKQQRMFLERKEKELSLELQKLSGYREKSYGGIRYYFEVRLGTIDYNSIPELQQMDLNKYRKPSQKAWKLEVQNI